MWARAEGNATVSAMHTQLLVANCPNMYQTCTLLVASRIPVEV